MFVHVLIDNSFVDGTVSVTCTLLAGKLGTISTRSFFPSTVEPILSPKSTIIYNVFNCFVFVQPSFPSYAIFGKQASSSCCYFDVFGSLARISSRILFALLYRVRMCVCTRTSKFYVYKGSARCHTKPQQFHRASSYAL